MLLVDEYRLRELSMSSGKISHKKAWDEMSTTMNAKGHMFSGRQCMTKINIMKRTYKTIKDHNSKSGNNNRTWKYYEVMESLLREKAYMDPLLTISSTGSVTYKSGKLKSADSCSNDSSSESSGPVSHKEM
ncbi:uncharacterized protein LOC105192350 isoform X2 [Harpegnathos saltator]|uniref:uncharacterized protein LOC105192350 isoform X2 n=1 Tax=Harpegnathos saltator TaxID=610380 RepID=UPI000DBEEBD6|nr:uncharacterized protein LOC105192350 isoform X2 [Harpegnathos saltator]